jgi:hypothetical protein
LAWTWGLDHRPYKQTQQTKQKLAVGIARWTCRSWVSGGSYGHPDHENMGAEHGAELGCSTSY